MFLVFEPPPLEVITPVARMISVPIDITSQLQIALYNEDTIAGDRGERRCQSAMRIGFASEDFTEKLMRLQKPSLSALEVPGSRCM
jgi:hypothetical protein